MIEERNPSEAVGFGAGTRIKVCLGEFLDEQGETREGNSRSRTWKESKEIIYLLWCGSGPRMIILAEVLELSRREEPSCDASVESSRGMRWVETFVAVFSEAREKLE